MGRETTGGEAVSSLRLISTGPEKPDSSGASSFTLDTVTPALDRAGRSGLHYAALDGRMHDVDLFIRCGDKVDLADVAGFTPLHFAAQSAHAEIAERLLAAGADVNARNRFGNTPLWVALEHIRDGKQRIVDVLLEAGADPDAKNDAEVSPRDLSHGVPEDDMMQFFPGARRQHAHAEAGLHRLD